MSSASFLSSKQSSHPWCYCTIHAASFRDMHFAFHLISSVFEGISVLKIFWTEMISLFSILFKLVGLFLLTSKDLHTLQFKISKYIKYLDYMFSCTFPCDLFGLQTLSRLCSTRSAQGLQNAWCLTKRGERVIFMSTLGPVV